MGHESQSPEEHQRRLAEQQAASRRRAAEAQRREAAKRKAAEEAERRHAAKPQQDEATIAAKAAEARKRFRARIEVHEAELRAKAEQAQQYEATKATLNQIRYKALAQKATHSLEPQAQTSVAPAAPLQQSATPSPVQPVAVIAAEPAGMALASWDGPNILPINAQTNLMGTAATERSDVQMQFTEGVQSRPLMAGAFALPAAAMPQTLELMFKPDFALKAVLPKKIPDELTGRLDTQPIKIAQATSDVKNDLNWITTVVGAGLGVLDQAGHLIYTGSKEAISILRQLFIKKEREGDKDSQD